MSRDAVPQFQTLAFDFELAAGALIVKPINSLPSDMATHAGDSPPRSHSRQPEYVRMIHVLATRGPRRLLSWGRGDSLRHGDIGITKNSIKAEKWLRGMLLYVNFNDELIQSSLNAAIWPRVGPPYRPLQRHRYLRDALSCVAVFDL
jgi:hypothetical protein